MILAPRWSGALLMVALACGMARAQNKPAAGGTAPTAPAQAAPVGAEPNATTASYGDWLVRCASTDVPTGPKHTCEAVQTLRLQGQQAPFAQVAFGRIENAASLHLVIALPVNVAFPSAVRVELDKDPKPLDLAWNHCLPGACFADAVVGGDLLERWRVATTPARLRFTDASRREVVIPVSFRGLPQALDTLQKQP